MTAAWSCQTCDATGTGEQGAVDKAAERHTKTTGHGTVTSAQLTREDA